MNKFAGFLLCLAAVVGGCANPTVGRSRASTTEYPRTLTGTEINGIMATFEIAEYGPETGCLKGDVLFSNAGQQTRTVRMFDLFYLHLALQDAKGQTVPTLDGIGAVNPTTREYWVSPQGSLKVPFSLRIPDFFNVHQGTYQLSFVYDMRLLERTMDLGGKPFRRWSSGSIPLTFTAGRIDASVRP